MASTPPSIIWQNGARVWLQNGFRHRDGDKPAYIDPSGLCIWYCNGVLHRDDDKPAVVASDGLMIWYRNGVMRRNDTTKPQVLDSDGCAQWEHTNGRLVRSITNFQQDSLRFVFVLWHLKQSGSV